MRVFLLIINNLDWPRSSVNMMNTSMASLALPSQCTFISLRWLCQVSQQHQDIFYFCFWLVKTEQNAGPDGDFHFFLDLCEGGIDKRCLTICLCADLISLRTDDQQWTVFFSFLYFFMYLKLSTHHDTMPMKRSIESSGGDGVFLIHSLTKTLCSSPEEIHTDFNGQTHFHQEDDSGVKSGNAATTLSKSCIINIKIL